MQPQPQPSFLEREIAGVPLWVHLLAGVVSCGVYLVILPFVLVISAVEDRITRAVDRVIDSAMTRAFHAALMIVSVPARLVHRFGQWAHARYTGRTGTS